MCGDCLFRPDGLTDWLTATGVSVSSRAVFCFSPTSTADQCSPYSANLSPTGDPEISPSPPPPPPPPTSYGFPMLVCLFFYLF